MPVRAIYVNNPFYNAGRRERRFYGRFYLRDVHTVCYRTPADQCPLTSLELAFV